MLLVVVLEISSYIAKKVEKNVDDFLNIFKGAACEAILSLNIYIQHIKSAYCSLYHSQDILQFAGLALPYLKNLNFSERLSVWVVHCNLT